MKTIMSSVLIFVAVNLLAGEGYKVGDKAADFKLKNVDGKLVSLADFPSAKGFVVVFTCNNCPYAKAYQDRIIALDKEFKAKGFPVIAINPNDPSVEPGDSYDAMVTRAKEKGYTFPYLYDEKYFRVPKFSIWEPMARGAGAKASKTNTITGSGDKWRGGWPTNGTWPRVTSYGCSIPQTGRRPETR